MKKILVIGALLALAAGASAQPAEVVAKLIRSTERLQVRARQIDSIVVAITGSSTHRQLPTAKAVYDYLQSVLPARAGHVIQDDGVTRAKQDTLNFESSPTIDASATNAGGKTTVSMSIPEAGITALEIAGGSVGNSELATNSVDSTKIINGGVSVRDLGQHGATDNNILRWNGTQWYPSAQTLYDVVTTSQTIAAKNNQVWVNTLSAAITLNLPACNAANDGASFQIAKAGGDDYSVDIEPAGSETFIDGTTTKTIFSQGTGLLCTCRYHIGSPTWLFISM